MAMDRLSDFKLGISVVIKADKGWRGVGLPQVAIHSQLPGFLGFVSFTVALCFGVFMNKDVCKLYAIYKSRFLWLTLNSSINGQCKAQAT